MLKAKILIQDNSGNLRSLEDICAGYEIFKDQSQLDHYYIIPGVNQREKLLDTVYEFQGIDEIMEDGNILFKNIFKTVTLKEDINNLNKIMNKIKNKENPHIQNISISQIGEPFGSQMAERILSIKNQNNTKQ